MNPNLKKHDEMRRQNRMVYTIMAVSLLVLGILISISVISARRSDERKVIDRDVTITDVSPAPKDKEIDGGQAAAAIPARPDDSAPQSDTAADTDAAASVTPEDETSADTTAEAEANSTLPKFIPVAIGQVSKGFSVDLPVYSMTMDDYRVHRGIDIQVPVGSDVFAAAAGTISAVWEDPLAGCALRIEHIGGAVSTYYNLSPETVEVMRPGTAVAAGEVIGTVGDTTLIEISDDPHVHYELTVNGVYVDPCAYANYTAAGAVYEG